MYPSPNNMMCANGILVIYYQPAVKNANTITEHVESFGKYSKFNVWTVNVAYGFPRELRKLQFTSIILHYSLFGSFPFDLPEKFRKYIEQQNNILKVAFFQDEYRHCRSRFALIDRLSVNIIYSILEPKYFESVYLKNSKVQAIYQTLTGYVCNELIEKSKKFIKTFEDREVDVGYRARVLPFYMGKGAQEKTDIAIGFLEFSSHLNFRNDIKVNESDRLYGDRWISFIANCKFMLGVESGTSIFDMTGEIQQKVSAYIKENPNATFNDVSRNILEPYEGKINYRAISPRIFECASLKTCMILFRGDYQNIIEADKHYIMLEKDFSNFAEVVAKMKDRQFVEKIIDQAYQDLIVNSKYTYSAFIAEVDSLISKQSRSNLSPRDNSFFVVDKILNRDILFRRTIAYIMMIRYLNFPGRNLLVQFFYKLGYKRSIRCAE